MPELAEVEFNRKQWNCGMGKQIEGVLVRAGKRVLRGVDIGLLEKALTGATLESSEAHGKQMVFRFSGGVWLGVHLGMTGSLRAESAGFQPGKHDHLALHMPQCALVFSDPRQFGRILFFRGAGEPDWWASRPAALDSDAFTAEFVAGFLRRHGKAPIKAVLLLQAGFPGLGNWMVDEILWRSGLHPGIAAGKLSTAQTRVLWKNIRYVSREALKRIGEDYSDPPKSWLFQHRWAPGGRCPKDGALLERKAIGGRTSVWCPECQPAD